MIYHTMPRTRDSKWLFYFALFASIFLILVGVGYRVLHNGYENPLHPSPREDDILLRVGNETIYYRDLTIELASYPDASDENAKELLTQKLITDSIILQGGKDDGILELEPDFFNSPEKNYERRIEEVSKVKDSFQTNSVQSKGYVVAVWFRNNGYVGPRGLNGSKELARKKLTALHTEVAEGRMSIQKAGEILKNDTSLKELDIAYKNNAIFPFTIYNKDSQHITLNKNLDTELMQLPEGGVSSLYLGTTNDKEVSEPYEALYMFGQITEKGSGSKPYISFDDWLKQKREIYKVENH